ncbi:phage tail protein, partial [Pantoea agglomerans]|uniref:phage tail protein n=1 Tax=Enterobacter agglomerans TaxID=549 RepID=UPI003C7E957D
MTTKYFALLTNQGAAKLANAAALGTKVNIASMGVGDGGGTLPTPDAAQTKLIGEKRRAQLNSLTVDAANSSQIIAEQIIPESEGGFWIREIGLYDADGVLIAVANCPETYKPQLAEGSGRTQTVRMILIVNSTTAVTLKIDPSVVLATRQYVDDAVIEVKAYADSVMKKHIDADNPHSQYLQIANALAEIKDAGLIADVLKNLGLGDAAKKTVGNGADQLPDMSFFAAVKSGNGYTRLPNGVI